MLRFIPKGLAWPIVSAIALHVLVGVILLVSMQPNQAEKTNPALPLPVASVDQQLVEQELKRLELEKQEKKRQAELERKALAEKRAQQELEKKRKAKQARQAQLKRQQEQEKKRKAELERKALAEKRTQQELEKKRKAKQARQAQLKRQQEQEKKRKAELERKALAEKRAQQELEKKRKAEQARQAQLKRQQERQQKEAALSSALQREEQLSQTQAITARIKADVENSWLIPPSARVGMECLLQIRLLPSGDVHSVKLVRSSGDTAFDRSALDAVYKASPLPVSVSSIGSQLFNRTFREFSFRFSPDNS